MRNRNLQLKRTIFGILRWSALLVFCVPQAAQSQHQDPGEQSDALRESIQRAIVPIERAMVGYRENRRCFSCHHHTHAIIGLTEMARHGLEVDRELLQFQFRRIVGRTQSILTRYQKNQNIGGGVDTAGNALLAMRIGGHQPDPMTEAIVTWILKRNRDQGFWSGTKTRAPTQTSHITRTWLCLDALQYFGTPSQREEIDDRESAAREWLLNVDVLSTEDKNSRIRALTVFGGARDEIGKFAEELVAEQNDDGGWAQTDEMESDAYATGSVLMTLHQYAGLSTNRKTYRRGVEFLGSTQLDDGTWHVKSRATPVQKYFESGFPHGRDQYISFTATCWAATAMAFALPEPAPENDRQPIMANLAEPMLELDEEHERRFQSRFDHDIWPLISDNGKLSCVRCHDRKHRSSFRLTGDSKTDFRMMLGNGMFHPHDPDGILFTIASENPEIMMPPRKLPRLNQEQVETLTRFANDLYHLQDHRK